MEIKGRDLIEGIPKTLTVTDGEIREAMSEPVSVDRERGPRGPRAHATRALGGHRRPRHRAHRRRALLRGLDASCARKPAFRSVAENPLSCVVLGTGRMLTDFDLLRKISIE